MPLKAPRQRALEQHHDPALRLLIMRLDIKRKLLARSDRVKSIDFHPTEPWIISSLYNGQVFIWNHETQLLVKTFELTDVPIRACKFIARKNWFVCGADDFQLRVYNYNTGERVASFEAHPDYVRALAVHPTQPFVLTSSDDMTIRCWNWEQNWKLVQTYEGHAHFVMSLAINPKDPNTFASACLDRTVKVWSLGSPTANFTLDAHEKGVNYVDYYHGNDRPYIITTGDDKLIKIWDYQTKACVQVLEGHSNNVSFSVFHPELPVIISGAEDGLVKIWHSTTYRLEETINYGLERAWAIAYIRGSNSIAIGFDEGSVVFKMGSEEPAVSMDNSGKIVWARNVDIQSTVIKPAPEDLADGARLPLALKDVASSEIYPQFLKHSPNGRFVVVCGDGEYIIYTALAWRNMAFGSALDFAWSSNSNEYAIRDSIRSIRIFRNFKESPDSIDLGFDSEQMFGGKLIAARGRDFVAFYSWDSGSLIRVIEVVPNNIYWSEAGNLLTLACNDAFYILRFNRDALDSGEYDPDHGYEDAFEAVSDIEDSISTGIWIGDCFVYTTQSNRLNYIVGGQVRTIANFDQPLYLMGYMPRDGRVYLVDKSLKVVSYKLSLAVIEYQTVVLRGDMELAAKLLESIPSDQHGKISRFLEGQGYNELALEISTDPEHKFDLALTLGNLDLALELARESQNEAKWKTVGDAALAAWNLDLARECFVQAKDLGSMLLFFSSIGDRQGLASLQQEALSQGLHNNAFICAWMLHDTEACIKILEATGRFPEAGLFGLTYAPAAFANVLASWKRDLEASDRRRVAQRLAAPDEEPELFAEWNLSGLPDSIESDLLIDGPAEPAEPVEPVDSAQPVDPLA